VKRGQHYYELQKSVFEQRPTTTTTTKISPVRSASQVPISRISYSAEKVSGKIFPLIYGQNVCPKNYVPNFK
jgi:hypothetical protein